MTIRASTCEPQRVKDFLAGTLGDYELRVFEQHLDTCAKCRAELDQRTATPAEWNELQTSLSGGDEPPGNESRESLRSELENYRKLLGPSDDPQMAGRIGTYEIIGLLGRGGMGIVFKGFDSSLNRYVAIKLLAPLYLASGAAKQRFVREARSSAAVLHENVVGIHAISEWQGVPYLVMTFVRGESLQKRIAQRGALTLREVLRIGLQIAQGLAAAHAQGLIHRDIKPANILLESEVDRVKITDFGLARAVDDIRLTGSDTLLGTPEYMSPEQARDEPLDFRTDLFSLGCVLYEASTGRSPFRATTGYGAIRKVIDHEPKSLREFNSELPDWLDVLLFRLLAKRPEDRFSSASDVAATLQQCLAHVEQPRLASLPESVVRKTSGSPFHFSRRFTMVTVLSFLALAGSAIFFAASGDNLSDQSDLVSNPDPKESKVLVADNRDEEAKSSRRKAVADEDRSEGTEKESAESSDDTDATSNESSPDNGDTTSAILATAGGHEIRLRKVDGVAQMQKSIKLDPGKLLAQGTSQSVTRSSQSSGQNSSSSQGSSQGGGFSAGGGSSSSSTSSSAGGGFSGGGVSTGGRPFNPTLALAFDIQPTKSDRTSRGKKNSGSRSRTNSSDGVNGIAEVSAKLIATGENGQELAHQANNPMTMRCLEFENTVPGSSVVYLEELQQVEEIASLKGDLIVTPGRILVAEFTGTARDSQRVDGETFTLNSVTEGNGGIQVSATLPPTTRQKRARTFEEQFKVLTDSMGAFDVTLEDDNGDVYSANSGGSSGGSSSGSSSGGGNGFNNGNGNVNQSSSSSQSFSFAALPPGRSIKKIRVKMTDRIGEPRSYPFEMRDVPVPFPTEE
jgi:serine/threonine protein kinase